MSELTPDERQALINGIIIPIPSIDALRQVKEADSLEALNDALDEYFGALIEAFPNETQKLLMRMFYFAHKMYEDPSLLGQGHAAQAAILHKGESYDFCVFRLPPITRDNPWFKLLMIEEVVVHIGQFHSRLTEVGPQQFKREMDSGLLSSISETSAAFVTKPLVNNIPATHIAKAPVPTVIQFLLMHDLVMRRNISFMDALSLKEEKMTQIAEEDLALFLERVQHVLPALENFGRNEGPQKDDTPSSPDTGREI